MRKQKKFWKMKKQYIKVNLLSYKNKYLLKW